MSKKHIFFWIYTEMENKIFEIEIIESEINIVIFVVFVRGFDSIR